jgi:predicted nucleic acid-binding protein
VSVLIDTGILVDYLRDRPPAVDFVESLAERPFTSAMTVAELFQGVKEEERDRLGVVVRGLGILEATAGLAERAGLIARRYRPSHGTGLVDAVIAVTALAGGHTLATLNRRHFPMIEDLEVPY